MKKALCICIVLVGIIVFLVSCTNISTDTAAKGINVSDFQIEDFESLLEKSDISDAELEYLNMHLVTQEIPVGSDDYIKIRLIAYSTPIEGIGTLAHSWTFAEISHGNRKTVQKLYEQSPNVSRYMKLFRNDDDLYVIIVGYTTVYTPRPLFASFWKVSDLQLVQREILSEVEEIPSGIVRCYENELIIESYESQLSFDGFQGIWKGSFRIVNNNNDDILNIAYSESNLIVTKMVD